MGETSNLHSGMASAQILVDLSGSEQIWVEKSEKIGKKSKKIQYAQTNDVMWLKKENFTKKSGKITKNHKKNKQWLIDWLLLLLLLFVLLFVCSFPKN